MTPVQADFFLRFPERSRLGALIAGVHVTARKADLTGMMGQVIRPLGKQRRKAIFAFHKGYQNGSRHQLVMVVQARVEVVVTAVSTLNGFAAAQALNYQVSVHTVSLAVMSALMAELFLFGCVSDYMKDSSAPNPQDMHSINRFCNCQVDEFVEDSSVKARLKAVV